MNLEKQYRNISLTKFLELLDIKKFSWIIKRLSGNDTGLTGGHQVGMYIPKTFVEDVLPEINSREIPNPDKIFDCYIASHDCLQENVRAIYYNNKFTSGGTRNESRITCWAGSPLQDVENTGSICIFACLRESGHLISLCWVARSADEEELIEYWLGMEVEPGQVFNSRRADEAKDIPLFKQLPVAWFDIFPSGKEIFDFIVSKVSQADWSKTVDELLLKRRALEFDVFAEIERRDVLPRIKDGFTAVDEFVKYANSVANRRKSRAGTSLELHLESIFRYEQLQFETQVVTEQNKKPDFIFPSGRDYHDPVFPSCKLHMLAAKTCCKDRWRQVINEADRISPKHLFTLQEGVSGNQLNEMSEHGIVLVVPQPIMKSFPKEYHGRIMNLGGFMDYIKASQP